MTRFCWQNQYLVLSHEGTPPSEMIALPSFPQSLYIVKSGSLLVSYFRRHWTCKMNGHWTRKKAARTQNPICIFISNRNFGIWWNPRFTSTSYIIIRYHAPAKAAEGQWAPAVPPYALRCHALSPSREFPGPLIFNIWNLNELDIFIYFIFGHLQQATKYEIGS